MTKTPTEPLHHEPDPPPSQSRIAGRAPTRGRLHGITPEGVVLVAWRGGDPRPAELALDLSHGSLLRAIEDRARVLVDFIDGDAEQPVVLGLLRSRLDVDARDPSSTAAPTIDVVAGESLSLRCGESAIELRRDGQVVIRGVELRSVATGGNTIQGAHVEIN